MHHCSYLFMLCCDPVPHLWSFSWFAAGGMANITSDQSSRCHGVLHHGTAQEFEVLKEIESSYGTAQLPVTPYTPFSSSTATTDGPHSQHAPSATCHAISPAAPANSSSSGPIVPGVPVTATAFIVSPERVAVMTQVNCPLSNLCTPSFLACFAA